MWIRDNLWNCYKATNWWLDNSKGWPSNQAWLKRWMGNPI